MTLEPDVESRIADACRSSGKAFKDVVNEVLRRGFAIEQTVQTAPPLVIEPFDLEFKPGISLVSISALEALIEEESFR